MLNPSSDPSSGSATAASSVAPTTTNPSTPLNGLRTNWADFSRRVRGVFFSSTTTSSDASAPRAAASGARAATSAPAPSALPATTRAASDVPAAPPAQPEPRVAGDVPVTTSGDASAIGAPAPSAPPTTTRVVSDALTAQPEPRVAGSTPAAPLAQPEPRVAGDVPTTTSGDASATGAPSVVRGLRIEKKPSMTPERWGGHTILHFDGEKTFLMSSSEHDFLLIPTARSQLGFHLQQRSVQRMIVVAAAIMVLAALSCALIASGIASPVAAIGIGLIVSILTATSGLLAVAYCNNYDATYRSEKRLDQLKRNDLISNTEDFTFRELYMHLKTKASSSDPYALENIIKRLLDMCTTQASPSDHSQGLQVFTTIDVSENLRKAGALIKDIRTKMRKDSESLAAFELRKKKLAQHALTQMQQPPVGQGFPYPDTNYYPRAELHWLTNLQVKPS